VTTGRIASSCQIRSGTWQRRIIAQTAREIPDLGCRRRYGVVKAPEDESRSHIHPLTLLAVMLFTLMASAVITPSSALRRV
jgi:hypothetical protein